MIYKIFCIKFLYKWHLSCENIREYSKWMWVTAAGSLGFKSIASQCTMSWNHGWVRQQEKRRWQCESSESIKPKSWFLLNQCDQEMYRNPIFQLILEHKRSECKEKFKQNKNLIKHIKHMQHGKSYWVHICGLIGTERLLGMQLIFLYRSRMHFYFLRNCLQLFSA